MLKKLRLAISVLIFALLTFYFLDFAGILPAEIQALAQIQFIPAWMSRNAAVFAGLALCAMLFGRIYCSSICPMGTFQDIISRCFKGRQYAYGKNNPALRWSIAAISLIPFYLGSAAIIGLLDPYSAYGRIAVNVLKPVYMLLNNILASVFNNFGSYALYRTEIAILSVFSLIVASLSFAIVAALAWAKGRLYCNAICPVGTVLGFMNKFSLFKIRINGDKCASCGICEKKCKASCIDSKNRTIDYSRCVNCFNCINNCSRKGISFSAGKWRKEKNKSENSPADASKRRFLLAGLAGAIAAPAAFAQAKTGPQEHLSNAISPPGAVSEERLLKHCTSCHLCISKCPSKALKPAFMEYGIGGMMMPAMHFEKGFCNFDCTICANACPNDALVSLTVKQKHRLQVGRVVFKPELCIVHTEGWSCGACSEHCPTQAVKMIPCKNGLTIPFIDADICVGCGGCEFICPVRPKKAIYVKGNKIHGQARAFEAEEKEEKEITDFGF